MKSKIIAKLQEEERKAFLKLDPVDRILTMERRLHELLSIKASEEGVSEGEIYYRYLERDKKRRHAL